MRKGDCGDSRAQTYQEEPCHCGLHQRTEKAEGEQACLQQVGIATAVMAAVRHTGPGPSTAYAIVSHQESSSDGYYSCRVKED